MGTRLARALGAAAGLVLAAIACDPEPARDVPQPDPNATAGWPAYGGDAGGSRYSPLAEIHRANVADLEVAWTYRTGDLCNRPGTWERSSFQSTPIVVDGLLVLSTSSSRVIALDPERGEERWVFDPGIRDPDVCGAASRGVSSWLDPERATGAACRRRIFLGNAVGQLIALDARTGRPCLDFGERGFVDLRSGVAQLDDPEELGVTSPPGVLRDLVVVGSAIRDNQRVRAPRGIVRAFDARSGALRWSWDPIPRDSADPAFATWRGDAALDAGAANVWAPVAVDPERDLVFVATSSPSPDYYGGERLGSNLYSDAVVALRGASGAVVWHFQTVHHDLWDYDVPAQPTLATLRRDGAEKSVVVQPTKMGHLFVLHRETGEPVFPIEERRVPPSDVPGEAAWPTQPVPARPRPLHPDRLGPEDAWGLTFWDRGACRERLEGLRSEGIFTPPSRRGTVVFPSNVGGTNWGGAAFDPERGLVIANESRVPMVVTLVPRDEFVPWEVRGVGDSGPQLGTPFGMRREALLSPLGIPCNPPPWGVLYAVDLATGDVRWEVPLGSTRGQAPWPFWLTWGTPSLGGPLATAGGLAFIGAATDQYLRAFDVETGEELWKAHLPAGAHATPMTFRLRQDGRQLVVIAAGGHHDLPTARGDYVIAFALPR
jgi:quinoprotein glucose dehydrogenase